MCQKNDYKGFFHLQERTCKIPVVFSRSNQFLKPNSSKFSTTQKSQISNMCRLSKKWSSGAILTNTSWHHLAQPIYFHASRWESTIRENSLSYFTVHIIALHFQTSLQPTSPSCYPDKWKSKKRVSVPVTVD